MFIYVNIKTKRKTKRNMETYHREKERKEFGMETYHREKERKEFGFESWTEAVISAQDRSKRRGLVSSPILHKERRN
jgi:hypothetical protein